jgi:hypothetical protein
MVDGRMVAAATGAVPGPARLARAGVFGAASVCLALAGHVAAGGQRPSTVLLAVSVGLLTRVAYGCAHRERALGAVGAAVVGTQLLLHAAFTLATHDHGNHLAGPAAGYHPPAGLRATELLPGGGPGAGLLPGGLMAAAHLVAALAVAGLIHRAERRLWVAAELRVGLPRAVAAVATLAGAARAAVAALAGPLAGATGSSSPLRPAAPGPSVAPCVGRPSGRLLGRASRRRGPPRPAAASLT